MEYPILTSLQQIFKNGWNMEYGIQTISGGSKNDVPGTSRSYPQTPPSDQFIQP